MDLLEKIGQYLAALRHGLNLNQCADPYYAKTIFSVLKTSERSNDKLFLSSNWAHVVRVMLRQLMLAQASLPCYHNSEAYLRKIILITLEDLSFKRFTLSDDEFSGKAMRYMSCRLLCCAYTNNSITSKDALTRRLFFMLDSYGADFCRAPLLSHRDKITGLLRKGVDASPRERFNRVCFSLVAAYHYLISLHEVGSQLKSHEHKLLVNSEIAALRKLLVHIEQECERLVYRIRRRPLLVKRREATEKTVVDTQHPRLQKKRHHASTSVSQLTDMMGALNQGAKQNPENSPAKKSKPAPQATHTELITGKLCKRA